MMAAIRPDLVYEGDKNKAKEEEKEAIKGGEKGKLSPSHKR